MAEVETESEVKDLYVADIDHGGAFCIFVDHRAYGGVLESHGAAALRLGGHRQFVCGPDSFEA